MKQILHIMSSPRGESSASRKMGKKLVQQLLEKYAEARVVEYDLSQMKIPHLAENHINAFFKPAEQRTEKDRQDIVFSDKALLDLHHADILVVEAPMYNWNIPSTLKAYFDHIARAGHTFKYKYKEDSLLPTGLLKNKQAYIVTSSGGVYSEGKLKDYDFVTKYVAFFLELIGIEVTKVFRAEGQAIFGPEEALNKGIQRIVADMQG